MSQRGETAFCAMRVGRIHDPREVVAFAAELKVRPAEALGYVMLWESFILEVGDGLTGRVKGYRAEHIAAALTYPGSPARLIKAMENSGVLRRQRTTFFHPYFHQTPTGHYARQRAERREYEREKKRRQREGGGDENQENSVPTLSPGTNPGQTGDSPGDRQWNPDIKKERSPGDSQIPPSPPQAGGVGFARWEVMEKHWQRVRNPSACAIMLEAMSDEYWAVCRWVVENRVKERLSSISKKKRAFGLTSSDFLSQSAFLEFRPEYLKKLEAPKAVPLELEQAQKDRAQVDRVRSNYLALTSDPDAPPEAKNRARDRFLRANPDQEKWLEAAERGEMTDDDHATNGVSH